MKIKLYYIVYKIEPKGKSWIYEAYAMNKAQAFDVFSTWVKVMSLEKDVILITSFESRVIDKKMFKEEFKHQQRRLAYLKQILNDRELEAMLWKKKIIWEKIGLNEKCYFMNKRWDILWKGGKRLVRKRVILRTTIDKKTMEFLKMIVEEARLEKSLGRLIDKMAFVYAKELKNTIELKSIKKETITE